MATAGQVVPPVGKVEAVGGKPEACLACKEVKENAEKSCARPLGLVHRRPLLRETAA